MKPSEIIASVLACILIGLVVRTIIVDHPYMDAGSWALATIAVGMALMFVVHVFILNRMP